MIRSLLLPLDGSEFSERSLPLARSIAHRTGATLHLAHVHRGHVPDHFLSNTQFHFEGLDLEEYEARHRKEETEYLEGIAANLRDEGLTVDTALLDGHVAEELDEHARTVGADLIILTTHGHSGMNRLWLGSSADALVRHTHVPIVVIHPLEADGVPEPAELPTHIVVALDGSVRSESILEPVKMLAQASGARVTLAHVVSSAAIMGARISPLRPTTVESVLDMASEYLGRVADQVSDDLPEVETRVASHESSAGGLAEIAKGLGADMIAIGTHGYGGIRRSVLGSVADKVLRSSPLPILVMRPKG